MAREHTARDVEGVEEDVETSRRAGSADRVRGARRDVPAGERFARWQELFSPLAIPLEVRSDPSIEFRAEVRHVNLGAVEVASVIASTCEGHWTPKRQEMLQLKHVVHGFQTFQQGRTSFRLRSSDLALYNASRPFQMSVAGECGVSEGIMVSFPRNLLPLSERQVERITTTPLSGRDGIGALLSGLLVRLATDNTDQYLTRDAPRLGNVVVDLVASLLAHELDAGAAVPPETHRQTLRLQVRSFIQQNLDNPDLSPGTIAAAHHMSTRTLHRLFQHDGQTVTDWIRQCRLQRCRQDLADPLLRRDPIQDIAARWGFFNPAHFSRLFRGAYGVNPQEYRDRHVSPRMAELN